MLILTNNYIHNKSKMGICQNFSCKHKSRGFMNNRNNPFKYQYDRLEDVADHISEVLDCPITIEDINHRLLAYSTHSDYTDPARTSTIIGRRVPEKVINKLWKDGTIPALMKTDEPIRVEQIDEVGLSSRVAISIWKNSEVIGFIWALESQKRCRKTSFTF